MSTDVAKLKAKHGLDSIPKNKLTLLINYAMRNVYLARNYFAGPVNIMFHYYLKLASWFLYPCRGYNDFSQKFATEVAIYIQNNFF